MANGVSSKFGAEMYMHPALLTQLEPAEIEREFVKPLLKAIAQFIIGRGGGMTPMASPIGRHFTKSNKERYGFAPLKPEYAKWKKKKVGNKPILVLTATWKKAAVFGAQIKSLGKKGYSVRATKAPHYAKYVEYGTKNMPARPAFTLNAEDRKAALEYGQEVAEDLAGDLISFTSTGSMVKVV